MIVQKKTTISISDAVPGYSDIIYVECDNDKNCMVKGNRKFPAARTIIDINGMPLEELKVVANLFNETVKELAKQVKELTQQCE